MTKERKATMPMKIDHDAIRSFYGRDTSVHDVVAGRVALPAAAARFMKAIRQATAQ